MTAVISPVPVTDIGCSPTFDKDKASKEEAKSSAPPPSSQGSGSFSISTTPSTALPLEGSIPAKLLGLSFVSQFEENLERVTKFRWLREDVKNSFILLHGAMTRDQHWLDKFRIHHPEKTLMDEKLVSEAILECLKENDTESLMEILEGYLSTLNRSKFSQKSKVSRRTLYHTLRNRNPTIKTLAKIISAACH